MGGSSGKTTDLPVYRVEFDTDPSSEDDPAYAEPTKVGPMSRAMIDKLMHEAERAGIVPTMESGVRDRKEVLAAIPVDVDEASDEPTKVGPLATPQVSPDSTSSLLRSLPPVSLRPPAFPEWVVNHEPDPQPEIDRALVRNIGVAAAIGVVFVALLVRWLFL